MRNVAFSILMFALAVVQIAVVSTEFSSSRVQVATAEHRESDARYALASTETERKAPAY
jgi:hypothetical protein